MRVSRLFLDTPLAGNQQIELDARTAHYVTNVLRLRAGDALQIFNGRGGAFEATLAQATRKRARVDVGQYLPDERESPLILHLALGVSRGERMDLAVQKATELGVTRITPVDTARSVAKLSGERAAKRLAHWQQIAVSACEQCGRNRVPRVAPIVDLPTWLASVPAGLKLVLATQATAPLTHAGEALDGTVILLIGAEGGLNSLEIELAQANGFAPVSLGPRVLRTETAALVAVALAQSTWGDL